MENMRKNVNSKFTTQPSKLQMDYAVKILRCTSSDVNALTRDTTTKKSD
jgi:hypothetical protein